MRRLAQDGKYPNALLILIRQVEVGYKRGTAGEPSYNFPFQQAISNGWNRGDRSYLPCLDQLQMDSVQIAVNQIFAVRRNDSRTNGLLVGVQRKLRESQFRNGIQPVLLQPI